MCSTVITRKRLCIAYIDGTGVRNWTVDLTEGLNRSHMLVQEYIQDPYSRFIWVTEPTEP